MPAVDTFKIDDIWFFRVGDHTEKGFTTKDEAQLMGEKYLAEKRKAEAKAKREAKKQDE
jgi:hypothetical protein